MKELLRGTPEIALFVCLALGFALGRIKFWRLSLGGIAGTLIVAIVVGMVGGGVTLNDQVKNIAFALFIFTLGYMSGPSFFSSLNRTSLRYGWFTLIEVVTVLAVTALAVVILKLDAGTAAGLMAGGATESAVVGTATDAVGRLPLPAAEIRTLQANIGTAYSISYICGLITIVLLTSQITPALLRFDLRESAAKLWKSLGGTGSRASSTPALPSVVGRAQRVIAGAGRTVAQVEAAMDGQATVERVLRDGQVIDVDPQTVLRKGDEVVVVGRRQEAIKADAVLGPELPGGRDLNLDLEVADVLLTRRDHSGQTLAHLRHDLPPEAVQGVYLRDISRMEHTLPIRPGTVVNTGDVVRIIGVRGDVERAAAWMGTRLGTGVKADFVYIAAGIVLGLLIGKLTLTLGDIPLSLGTGGGCLLTGLFFGWLRARHPTFGQYDPAAASVIKDLGLAVFISAVGLSSGPQAVSLITKYGLALPLVGILVTLVPATISLVVGFKVLKLEPPLALGAVAGQQCSTPAITAIQQVAGNPTPLMSYTIVYALSNVALPLLGPIAVGMARSLG
ncbi:aspartate-alanine antiporter [Streptosporangium saharense]|uniref:Aspartate-alanine antiporter n=1 Tax=Streptosporangium saharense TaxID=1706840 RepID=A0A7W7QHY5_9ACTN|nr:aspartate-alanine antiporter [Streptosporangium saharense]MBB4913927.1 aspartate-alanine antiporter [Streptosporangium saharense]